MPTKLPKWHRPWKIKYQIFIATTAGLRFCIFVTMLALQGRIDHGHHENEAQRALEQTLELDKAVSAALDLVDLEVIAYSLDLQCPGKD